MEVNPRGMCSHCLRPRDETGPLMASPLAAICCDCADRASRLIRAVADKEVTVNAPWDRLSTDELLAQLPNVARAADLVEEHLRTWVTEARRRRSTWAQIGEALGMARQSAWERFSRTSD